MTTKKRLTTKNLCLMALLLAVAFVLGVFSIRIGGGIKISLKFLPIVITSILFGPIWGGICGAVSDILAYFLNPGVGPLIWQITVVEFLYGLIYGTFLYKASELNAMTAIKATVCILLNTVLLSNFAMAYILMNLMSMSYLQTMIFRLPSILLNMCLHFAGTFTILKLMPSIRKLTKIS